MPNLHKILSPKTLGIIKRLRELAWYGPWHTSTRSKNKSFIGTTVTIKLLLSSLLFSMLVPYTKRDFFLITFYR